MSKCCNFLCHKDSVAFFYAKGLFYTENSYSDIWGVCAKHIKDYGGNNLYYISGMAYG